MIVQFCFAFLLGLVPAWGAEKIPIESMNVEMVSQAIHLTARNCTFISSVRIPVTNQWQFLTVECNYPYPKDFMIDRQILFLSPNVK
ncbi:MAG: hypothetical protein LBJ67_15225 [Planctomycetaceae bacterium]|nr:hypothetical protein [Planctomycetaceae bacterium]